MDTVAVDEQLQRWLRDFAKPTGGPEWPEHLPPPPTMDQACRAAGGQDPAVGVDAVALMVLAAVRDGDPMIRAALADALGTAEPHWQIALDEVLRQRWWWVPRGSQTTAAMLADDPTGDLDVLRLVAAGAHHDGHLRQAALARLAHVDHPAALAMVALRTGDWVPQVRDSARLASRRWLGPDTHPTVLASVAGVAFALRARRNGTWLADTIEQTLPGLPQPILRPLLAVTDRRTRRAAYRAAIASGRLPTQRLLHAAAKDADPVIRTMCARAAIATSDVATARTLLICRTALVRAEALQAVTADDPNAPEAVAALTDRHRLVRAVAQAAVIRAGSNPAHHYRRLVTQAPATPAVIAGLGETGNTGDAERIRPWLAHDRAPGRVAAIRALRRWRTVGPEELVPLLRDPSGAVARQVVAGLRPHLGSVPPAVLDALLEHANPPHVRLAGYRLLTAGDPWLRLATDLRLIDDPDPRLLATARADIAAWLRREAATVYCGPRPDQAAMLDRLIEHARAVLGKHSCTLLRFHAGGQVGVMSTMDDVTRMDLGPERWLTAPTDPSDAPEDSNGHTVAELLPDGFDAYLRLFHPFTVWRVAGRAIWQTLADQASVRFHAELMWPTLRPVLRHDAEGHRYQVAEGELEPIVKGPLYRHLSPAVQDFAYFYYGLAATVHGRRPLLFQAPLGAATQVADRVRASVGADLAGPEYLWPADRSWVVNTDYDLTSTYIACSQATAAALLTELALEILPVTRHTRVDDDADISDRPPSGTIR